ncbi:TonB-dependent receptor [Sphingobium lactosutens]|nr:TonB-dependent receptor [Sphingobium lactosutens]
MFRVSALLASTALIATAGSAFAQSDIAPQGDDGGIEEIVVTAQRREQRLQDVPVAVTALTAEALANRGINQVADVARAAPSLTVTQSQNPQNSSINLRGIGTNAFGIGLEPAVSVVVDDVALLQQAQAFSGLADIERIEVLRGPQGTLFGKNASAGVVNIVTQAPTDTLTASFGVTQTTDEQTRIEGSVSGRPNSLIAVRANAYYDQRDGYIRNLTTGNKLGAAESIGARVRADIDPVERLQISLTAAYSRDTTSATRTWRYVDPAARIFPISQIGELGNLVLPSLVGIDPGPDNFKARQNVEPEIVSKQSMYVGRATLDLDFANLISITSYQKWSLSSLGDDADYTDLPVVGRRTGGIVQSGNTNTDQFTQEVRLVSSGSQFLDYLLGAYYSKGNSDRDFQRLALGPGASNWVGGLKTRTVALFAQGTANFTDSTHLDAGIRWNSEKLSADFLNLVIPTRPPANNATCLTRCFGQTSDEQVTYKVALRQDISRDLMIYASYATGYKGQGFDLGTGASPDRFANPLQPEHSKAYEIGLKGTFLDRKLQVNLTGFWTDYDDFQAQSARVLADGTLDFRLNNVGKLRSRGVEADISLRPFRGLQFDLSGAYVDAKIRSFEGANCYTGQPAFDNVAEADRVPGVCYGASASVGTQDLSGSRLANAPKFKYGISGRYETELTNSGLKGFVQADWTHQSKVNFSLLGGPLTVQEGYGILNGSVGLEDPSGNYRVSLFANNLFDKSYASLIQAAQGESLGLATQQVLPRDARRYFGVRLRLRYR